VIFYTMNYTGPMVDYFESAGFHWWVMRVLNPRPLPCEGETRHIAGRAAQ
jgi:hypothetical protein